MGALKGVYQATLMKLFFDGNLMVIKGFTRKNAPAMGYKEETAQQGQYYGSQKKVTTQIKPRRGGIMVDKKVKTQIKSRRGGIMVDKKSENTDKAPEGRHFYWRVKMKPGRF